MQASAKFTANKDQLMNVVSHLLAEDYSWSEELLLKAEEICQFQKYYANILFNNSLKEAAIYFENWQDLQMIEHLSKLEAPLKTREKIIFALTTRIKQIVSLTTQQKTSSYFLLPQNIFAGCTASFETCDQIWRYAQDKSTNFDYYTKRGILLGVYKSAKLFYYADNSIDFIETEKYVATAVENVIKTMSKLKNSKQYFKLENIPILRLFS